MKITSIDSAAQDFKGAKHNIAWINLEAEGDVEKALVRMLAGAQGTVHIYNSGNMFVEFKIKRLKP